MHPQSTGKRIRLTERDLLWFEKINTHGPLSMTELFEFGKHLGGNVQRARNRLTDLFNEENTAHHATYLMRPLQQFQTMDARYKPLIYDLSKAGIKALKNAGRFHEVTGVSGGPWWHARDVAKFTAKVEIDTLNDPKHNYIPGWAIFERANTTPRYPTTFTDPYSGKKITKDLIPDAFFGIEYVRSDGKFYRFHCVEVDRGTEPKTSSNMARKSHERMLLQYEDYIGNGKYKEHLGLGAPMVCLIAEAENRYNQVSTERL